MYKSHYDCIKNNMVTTDNLMYEIKPENVYENFSEYKEMLHFSNC